MYLSGGYTHFSDEPEREAMEYIANRRLQAAIKTRVLGSPYDPDVKPVDIFACLRYLDLRGKKNWDCTCPVKSKSLHAARHSNTCLVSPEYATVSKQLDCAPELVCSAIGFAFWYLNWETWDVDKLAIRNLEGGQEFPWESEQKTP